MECLTGMRRRMAVYWRYNRKEEIPWTKERSAKQGRMKRTVCEANDVGEWGLERTESKWTINSSSINIGAFKSWTYPWPEHIIIIFFDLLIFTELASQNV